MALFTPDATLTDDGNEQDFVQWSDNEIFERGQGRLAALDREEDGGLTLYERFRLGSLGRFPECFPLPSTRGQAVRAGRRADRRLSEVEITTMNRIILGALLGIAFGVIDALITVFGKDPERRLRCFYRHSSAGLPSAFLAPTYRSASIRLPLAQSSDC